MSVRLINLAKRHLENKSYYDLATTVSSLIERMLKAGQFEQCLAICREYSQALVDAKEDELALDICNTFLTNATPQASNLISEAIEHFADVLKSASQPGIAKERLLKRLIHAADQLDQLTSEERINKKNCVVSAAVESFISGFEFCKALQLVIQSEDDNLLELLCTKWQSQCYILERDLFIAKLCLYLACIDKLHMADLFVENCLAKINYESPSVALQFAFLSVKAISSKNLEFWNKLKIKYFMVTRVDPDFKRFIGRIEQKYFCIEDPAAGAGDLFNNILSMLK